MIRSPVTDFPCLTYPGKHSVSATGFSQSATGFSEGQIFLVLFMFALSTLQKLRIFQFFCNSKNFSLLAMKRDMVSFPIFINHVRIYARISNILFYFLFFIACDLCSFTSNYYRTKEATILNMNVAQLPHYNSASLNYHLYIFNLVTRESTYLVGIQHHSNQCYSFNPYTWLFLWSYYWLL